MVFVLGGNDFWVQLNAFLMSVRLKENKINFTGILKLKFYFLLKLNFKLFKIKLLI